VTLKRKDPRAAEAGVKYVIIGGLSTALTIYGISMIYGSLGTLKLAALGPALAASGYTWAFVIGIITMVAGYGFKIAAAPFHMWAPDVYEGAATPVSTFLATGSKKMGLVVFFKIFLVMFVAAQATVSIEPMQYLFAIIAAISMTIGNVVAIAQNNIKRMLAYSSIAQAGYILIAMAVMSQYAVTGGLFHMFTHVFMKGGAFLVVGALICAGVGEKITDYNGLARRAPFLAFAMMVFLFSLAGVPPLAGFTSKFVLFSGAIYDGGAGAVSGWVWLAFVAILNSAISLYYYVRVIKAMYIERPNKGCDAKIKVPKTFLVAIVVCVVFVVVLGVYPDLILGPCADAAAVLFA
jgi:NADH-quinone oxidoreductase subunit N